MPTQPLQQPAPEQSQAPALAAPALARGVLRLPRARGPWTYLVSPTKLGCWRGKIIPHLAKASHEPGFCGNGRAHGHGEGMVAYMQTQGFTAIPHDMPGLSAFGTPRGGGQSYYLDRWEGLDSTGRPVVYWSEAWFRPRSLGRVIGWETDEEGWLDFLGRCLRLVSPVLDQIQIDLACQPRISQIRSLLDRPDSPRRKRLIDAHLQDLPREHTPEDLAEMMT